MNYHKLLPALLLLMLTGFTACAQLTIPPKFQLDIKGPSRLNVLVVPLQLRIPLDTLPHGIDTAGLIALQDSILYTRVKDSATGQLRWASNGGSTSSTVSNTVLNQYFSTDTTIINQINQQITNQIDSSISIINPQQTLQQVLITGNQMTRNNSVYLDTNRYNWYYRGVGTPIQLNDVGAMIAPKSSWSTVAPLLKVKWLRDGIYFNGSGGQSVYKSMSNANYSINLTVNANSIDGSHYFPAAGDSLDDFKCNFDSLMQDITTGNYRVKWIAVENEPNVSVFHKDPLHHLADYVNELSTAVAIGAVYGIRNITDGGLSGPDFKWVIWDWLRNQSGRSADAAEFQQYEFSNAQQASMGGWDTDPNHVDNINFCKGLLADLDTIAGIHAVNFHWYAPSWQSSVHDNSLIWAIQALKAMSGKDTVISNEMGQQNNVDSIPVQMLRVVSPRLAQVYWYDGDDAGGNGAIGLHDPTTNTLRTSGSNVVNFLQNASVGDTTIQRFLDFIGGEIYSINHKKAYTQRVLLDTSGKLTFQPQVTANVTAPSSDYTIVAPEQNQTFILPTLSANHTLTLPAGAEGQVIEVWNRNSAGFAWLLGGTAVKDAAETTLTQLANDTYYKLKMINGVWIKAN